METKIFWKVITENEIFAVRTQKEASQFTIDEGNYKNGDPCAYYRKFQGIETEHGYVEDIENGDFSELKKYDFSV